MFEAFIELAKAASNIGYVTYAMFTDTIITLDLVDNEGDTYSLSFRPALSQEAKNEDT